MLLLGVLGCVSAPRTPAPRAPESSAPAVRDTAMVPPDPLLPPDVNLSGGWYVGTGAEPQVDAIVLHPTCLVNPAAWVIEQDGNALRAWEFAQSFNQGMVRPNDAPVRVAVARGTISGSDVVLEDDRSRWVLRFDAASGHLRGTRNAAPFWAVRQQVVRTQACPPPP